MVLTCGLSYTTYSDGETVTLAMHNAENEGLFPGQYVLLKSHILMTLKWVSFSYWRRRYKRCWEEIWWKGTYLKANKIQTFSATSSNASLAVSLLLGSWYIFSIPCASDGNVDDLEQEYEAALGGGVSKDEDKKTIKAEDYAGIFLSWIMGLYDTIRWEPMGQQS